MTANHVSRRGFSRPPAGLALRWASARFLVAATVVATLIASGGPVAAQTDTEAERAEIRERREALVDQVDVLSATDAEIEAALDELDAEIAAQETAVTEAERDAARSATELRVARAALDDARRDVEVLEAAIVEMAVASYVHPPTADLVQSLQAASLSDAVLAQTYLDARARRDVDLLDLLELAETNATRRATEVAQAAEAADQAAATATAALASLRTEQNRQLSFAADLEERIDASLAEAAVLADLDAELSQQIVAEQQALLARIPPPPPVVEPPVAPTPVPTTVPSVTTTTVAGPTTTRDVPVDVDADEAVDPPAAPPTTVPAPPPTPSTSTPPLRTVQGITVHADIADDVDALLRAAAADGVSLSGWGYRSTQRQIELRIQNCGPTTYDIWVRSASTCSPPTAVPGRSLHEQGRAIDFTSGGRVITSRSTPAFRWLAANASSFGLFNLPSEPWHWSTSGG